MKSSMADISVIGGGAAGLFSAAIAAERGLSVVVYEPQKQVGRKLRITGKGRCNVTNNCDEKTFLTNVRSNPKFFKSALYAFPPSATMDYFKSLGVALKTERGNRVFPASDNANDVADALYKHCRDLNVQFVHQRVTSLPKGNVILATGGLSYPLTGSTGDGYDLAQSVGHTIVSPRPSLVGLEASDFCEEMQGLSLRNTELTLFQKDKKVYSEQGELLFTHFGLSGPLVLTASTFIKEDPTTYRIELDLKPALDEETLQARLLKDFSKNLNKDFINALDELLPQKMIPVLVRLSGIPERTKVNSITKEQRHKLLQLIKHFPIAIYELRPIEEAIITAGGVNVNEINPRTMESKLHPGLYFAGEIIDLDATTGGFNLQIAWSTAYTAANAIADSMKDSFERK